MASIRLGNDAQRVVRILGEAVGPVIVVAAATARLPELPADVRIVFDRRPERGPLEGLAAGLAALADLSVASNTKTVEIAAAFVTSCDAPLLLPAFVRRMVELIGSADVAVPKVDGSIAPACGRLSSHSAARMSIAVGCESTSSDRVG